MCEPVVNDPGASAMMGSTRDEIPAEILLRFDNLLLCGSPTLARRASSSSSSYRRRPRTCTSKEARWHFKKKRRPGVYRPGRHVRRTVVEMCTYTWRDTSPAGEMCCTPITERALFCVPWEKRSWPVNAMQLANQRQQQRRSRSKLKSARPVRHQTASYG
jgi:hypothetical protein